ncbi:MAG: hypothetical protein WD360_06205 [Nitriliruptoraceae bacterium]
MPASRVVSAANRFRAGIAHTYRATSPSLIRRLEAALGVLDLAILSVLCRLDVPNVFVKALQSSPAAEDGRVVVVESESHGSPRDDSAIRADLLMLALTPGGRQRTDKEIETLGQQAGLRRRSIHRLASGDVAYVFALAK